MDRLETAVLLQRARDGAPDALDAIYRRCGSRLLTLIRVRMGPSLRARLDSGDILQAALLKSFERFRQFEQGDGRSLMAWLATIAQNEIRDQAERHGRERRDMRVEVPLDVPDGEASVQPHSPGPSALSALIANERTRQLEDALDSLREDHREAILLRHFEDLTFAEVGERLGRSEDAARMLYARAMAALTMRMASGERR